MNAFTDERWRSINKGTGKIRVGAVGYLNPKPLVFGLEQGMMQDEIEFVEDYPAKIAAALLNDEIDIGLVPVAIIPLMNDYHINTDYCIGADGEVASVCLFSEVPVNDIQTVLLDYQSRTSVALVQVLMKEYWKISPEIKKAGENFRDEIKGTTAAVVIGDRAFEQRLVSKYSYDLAAAWKAHTGLPFVFAAWISRKKLPEDFVASFNAANKVGLDNLGKVLGQYQSDLYDLEKYFTENISYNLDQQKRQGLALFLEKLKGITQR